MVFISSQHLSIYYSSIKERLLWGIISQLFYSYSVLHTRDRISNRKVSEAPISFIIYIIKKSICVNDGALTVFQLSKIAQMVWYKKLLRYFHL